MISREELYERIKLRKESELKILRLNGANVKALEKRLEHLEEQRKEENDRHEEKLLELMIKDIAVTEAAEELNLL